MRLSVSHRVNYRPNRPPEESADASTIANSVTSDQVGGAVAVGAIGAIKNTGRALPSRQQRTLREELQTNKVILSDLAGSVPVGVTPSADLAEHVAISVASPADLAGEATVGVASLGELAGVVTVPRWRLAREGPFLSERSSSSLRCFGDGCAFRNTTYRPSDYAMPTGEFGVPMHHPRFLEWIGVPESASLLEMGSGMWLHSLSRDQAMDAALQLHKDVCLMTTNLDVLDQYILCMQSTASKILELGLGPRGFLSEEVAAGVMGPRVRRASVQMEAIGLWRPSLDLVLIP